MIEIRELIESGRATRGENGEAIVRKIGEVRALNRDTREVVVIASDASVDRMGDIIEPDGWRVENFLRNPVALVDHDYRVSSIVGTVTDTWTEGDRFLARIRLAGADANPLAERVWQMLTAGLLRAVSVGFRPIRAEKITDEEGNWTGGLRFVEQELLEISWVAVPANPNAVVASTDSAAAEQRSTAPDEEQRDDADNDHEQELTELRDTLARWQLERAIRSAIDA